MAQIPGTSKKTVWLGWVLTALPAAMFVLSASMKLSGNPKVVQMFSQLGWQPSALVPLACLELTCVLLYLIPRISILGGIVLTGYLGGAIATHVRLGEPVIMHIFIGLFIWGGLYLREPRLRELIPVKK
ncbi:MAG TPA: DoxX family protein [bacterium]|nr:DoxX family protein [bacterium]